VWIESGMSDHCELHNPRLLVTAGVFCTARDDIDHVTEYAKKGWAAFRSYDCFSTPSRSCDGHTVLWSSPVGPTPPFFFWDGYWRIVQVGVTAEQLSLCSCWEHVIMTRVQIPGLSRYGKGPGQGHNGVWKTGHVGRPRHYPASVYWQRSAHLAGNIDVLR